MNPEYYSQLIRPPLTPPDWVFGPVWTVLYVMIALGIFFWSRSPDRFLPSRTWGWIGVHLILNALWTVLFFTLESPLLALADILALLATLVWLLHRFRRESPAAFYLWLPYFLWVSFATYLNLGFWWLNRA
jgi:tryptophan-rich sensory protein